MIIDNLLEWLNLRPILNPLLLGLLFIIAREVIFTLIGVNRICNKLDDIKRELENK